MYRQILVQLPSAKFHENPLSHYLVICGETGRQTDMTKLIGKFLQLSVTSAPRPCVYKSLKFQAELILELLTDTKLLD
jgi:hypothetical protein